jgi:hypothetical protein
MNLVHEEIVLETTVSDTQVQDMVWAPGRDIVHEAHPLSACGSSHPVHNLVYPEGV